MASLKNDVEISPESRNVNEVEIESTDELRDSRVKHVHFDHGTIVKYFVFEQKAYFWPIGWGRPLFTRSWIGPDGKYVAKGSKADMRPETRLFRKILDGDDITGLPEDAWTSDWCIYTGKGPLLRGNEAVGS